MMKILLLTILMGGLSANAQESDSLTDQQKEELFIFQCGTIEQIAVVVKTDVKDITAADLEEINKSRASTLAVVRGGGPAIQQLLDQGNKNDIGGFGVLLVCGAIDQIAEQIKSRGCLDLTSKEVVNDGPGIDACKKIIANLKTQKP